MTTNGPTLEEQRRRLHEAHQAIARQTSQPWFSAEDRQQAHEHLSSLVQEAKTLMAGHAGQAGYGDLVVEVDLAEATLRSGTA